MVPQSMGLRMPWNFIACMAVHPPPRPPARLICPPPMGGWCVTSLCASPEGAPPDLLTPHVAPPRCMSHLQVACHTSTPHLCRRSAA